jgi:hypothetical protein
MNVSRSGSPDVIVTVESDADVIEAVKLARSRGLRISVRAGGHSWIATSLGDDGTALNWLLRLSFVEGSGAVPPFLLTRVRVPETQSAFHLHARRNAFCSPRCSSAIQIVRPLESIGWQMKCVPMSPTIPAHVYLIPVTVRPRA